VLLLYLDLSVFFFLEVFHSLFDVISEWMGFDFLVALLHKGVYWEAEVLELTHASHGVDACDQRSRGADVLREANH